MSKAAANNEVMTILANVKGLYTMMADNEEIVLVSNVSAEATDTAETVMATDSEGENTASDQSVSDNSMEETDSTEEENNAETDTAEADTASDEKTMDAAGMDEGNYNGELNMNSEGRGYDSSMMVDPAMSGTKGSLLSSWPFVIGVSSAALIVSIVLGALLARRKIKKGIELYED